MTYYSKMNGYSYMKYIKRNFQLSANLFLIKNYPKLITNKVLKHPKKELSLEERIFNSLEGKLVYNSLIARKNKAVRWRIREAKLAKNTLKPENVVPVSLKYLLETSEETSTNNDEIDSVEEDEIDDSHLPYKLVKSVEVEESDSSEIKNSDPALYQDVNPIPIQGKNWMSDYVCFDEQIENSSFELSGIDYGTPNPQIPPSNVPCGGCGAHLHCQNPSIPGYLPQELFKNCSKRELHTVICQRCTFLKNYNTALAVNVDPDTYPKLLAKIKGQKAVVVLMVDMTDFPCSIWPNLMETIGEKTPLIVVGNKIDLLPGDSPGWLEQAKKSLKKELPSNANILHVGFISAKSMYGIEELINKLYSVWGSNGDVYLVGCTNVGKSSLFNSFLNSDYCRVKAMDLVQKAVTSPWPGTTLNLLKFPIMKLTAWKAFLRTNRLKLEKKEALAEKKLAKIQSENYTEKLSRLPQIIGTISSTFKTPLNVNLSNSLPDEKLFTMPTLSKSFISKDNIKILNPKSHDFKMSHWCYDTPGVIHKDQIIDLFTIDEIMKLYPQKTIRPRVFSVRPNQTLLIGGVGRVDVLNCDFNFIRLIVYASERLPISLCETMYVKEVYETLLGTSYLGVPFGSTKRLSQWPSLRYVKDFEGKGEGNDLVCSEIVLSSAGWIGISTGRNCGYLIRPWTPDGRGIHERKIPVLRLTAKLRKSRIFNTPTYSMASI